MCVRLKRCAEKASTSGDQPRMSVGGSESMPSFLKNPISCATSRVAASVIGIYPIFNTGSNGLVNFFPCAKADEDIMPPSPAIPPSAARPLSMVRRLTLLPRTEPNSGS